LEREANYGDGVTFTPEMQEQQVDQDAGGENGESRQSRLEGNGLLDVLGHWRRMCLRQEPGLAG
jgi:hypothetical protein